MMDVLSQKNFAELAKEENDAGRRSQL